jgi:hypothetical protein
MRLPPLASSSVLAGEGDHCPARLAREAARVLRESSRPTYSERQRRQIAVPAMRSGAQSGALSAARLGLAYPARRHPAQGSVPSKPARHRQRQRGPGRPGGRMALSAVLPEPPHSTEGAEPAGRGAFVPKGRPSPQGRLGDPHSVRAHRPSGLSPPPPGLWLPFRRPPPKARRKQTRKLGSPSAARGRQRRRQRHRQNPRHRIRHLRFGFWNPRN